MKLTQAELYDRDGKRMGSILSSERLELLNSWLAAVLERRPADSEIGAVRPSRVLVIVQDGREERIDIYGSVVRNSDRRWVSKQELRLLDAIFMDVGTQTDLESQEPVDPKEHQE